MCTHGTCRQGGKHCGEEGCDGTGKRDGSGGHCPSGGCPSGGCGGCGGHSVPIDTFDEDDENGKKKDEEEDW